MDEKLILGIPDDEAATAPKKRFEIAERGARVNSLAILPFLAGGFGWLAQLLSDRKEDEEEGAPHGGGRQILQPAAADPELVTVDEPVDENLGKVSRIADYLREIAAPTPATPSLYQDLLNHDHGPIVYSPARPAGPPPPLRLVASEGRVIDGAGPGDPAPVGASPGSTGQAGLPANPETPADDAWPPDPADGGGGGDDTGDASAPDSPKDGGKGETKSSNRRPILSGPVVLGDGLVNVSVIISMGELLGHASDPDGDALSVAHLLADTGQLQQLDQDRWLYTPERDAKGQISFRYEISDGTDWVLQMASLDLLPPPGEWIEGTEGDDLLLGTPYDDLIDAGGGSDIVYGREGNDIIEGGAGDDRLLGGDGDDTIWGGAGNDVIYGGRGNDTIHGEDGDDTIFGEAGDDTLLGGAGSDVVSGGKGDDILDGGAGADTLSGGDGKDVISGGGDGDMIFGGDGDDTIFGESGDDTLSGDDGDDEVFGGEGDDVLDGGSGADLLHADAGDDEAHGGDGDDFLDGGSGDDLLFGDGGDDELAGGDGDDVLDGGSGADLLHADAGDDQVHGGDGDDVLDGGSGDDMLFGDGGDDELAGGDGDDVLSGGTGDDKLTGGAGDDVLDGGTGSDLIEAGDGDDTILVFAGNGKDTVLGGDGTDMLDLSNVFYDSIIDLPDCWFRIEGDETSELFEIENVRGGHGRDRLVADDHFNLMEGNGGNDTFVFRSLASLLNKGGPSDHILDFDVGDRLDLSRIEDFSGQKLFFAGAADAQPGEIGSITYSIRLLPDDQEMTVVTGNLDDDADPEFEIVLEGHHELTEQDFILAARDYETAHAG